MISSISSLSQMDIGRSSSPSPFIPSGNGARPRSPPLTPLTPRLRNGSEEGSAFDDTVDVIKKGHLEAARKSLRPSGLRDELEEEIVRDCESLRCFLCAAQVRPERSLGCPETNSAYRS